MSDASPPADRPPDPGQPSGYIDVRGLIVQATSSGADITDPVAITLLETVAPGAARELIALTREEMTYQHQIERSAASFAQIQGCGFSVALVGLIAGFGWMGFQLAMTGHDAVAGVALGVIGVGALGSAISRLGKGPSEKP